MFFFQNMSHKAFRWLAPFALGVLWIASALSDQPYARVLFILQCAFYACAAAGFWYGRAHRMPKVLNIPAYFVTVNLACLLAWFSVFKKYAIWTPPTRALGPEIR